MASGPTLPPQAYTREILTAAFNWLQTQPESVKKLATTPDALVGLYLRAQRFGGSSLEADAPVSSQNFMSDLKNLAEGLKQFEGPRNEDRNEDRSAGVNANTSARRIPPFAPMAPIMPSATPVTEIPPSASFYHESPLTLPPQGGLNERSWAMIQEVKNQLNLSSDADAINMMVALAYKNLKNLLA